MGTDDLKNLENWSHLNPMILKAGRITHYEPEGMGDEEKEEYMGKLAESDKAADRFAVIAEDEPVEKIGAAWTSKVCGDPQ
jgi:hypothetical protein